MLPAAAKTHPQKYMGLKSLKSMNIIKGQRLLENGPEVLMIYLKNSLHTGCLL
jgi:hypothetical protein